MIVKTNSVPLFLPYMKLHSIDTDHGERILKRLPTECPYCHKGITPTALYGHVIEDKADVQVLLHCPREECQESFIGYFQDAGLSRECHYLDLTSFGKPKTEDFSDIINELSPSFVIIYNESAIAEQATLHEICGVGYRKALEFLIKDYAIKNFPENRDEIIKQTLADTIIKFINDTKVKLTAQRASWLGNDETHYIRKWEGKTLADLKILINLTVRWIESDEFTKRFSEEMPRK
jgi:hypothetical protein